MYIIRKGITISLAILLNLNCFSGLFILGEETKTCFATAIEAQSALLSVFNLSSLPIEIVNKLFREENAASAPAAQHRKKQDNSAPVSQPVINELKSLEFDKKWGGINNSFEYTFSSSGIQVENHHFSNAGGKPCEPDDLFFLYILSFLIVLALSNLPASVFTKLNRIFPPGLSRPGFFILN